MFRIYAFTKGNGRGLQILNKSRGHINNFICQNGDRKQVLLWGPTNVRNQLSKFSRLYNLASGICASLERGLVTWFCETPHLAPTAACGMCENFQHGRPLRLAAGMEPSCVCNIYFVRMVQTFEFGFRIAGFIDFFFVGFHRLCMMWIGWKMNLQNVSCRICCSTWRARIAESV